jgi:SAM-dependent methyltransferase
MNEYDESDAAFYDHYSTGLAGEVEFYVEQARQAGGLVLELGCGTGRILIPVAEAGVAAVGLDRAAAMLAIAREKVGRCAREVQQRIEIVEGDMRELSLGRRFKLVMIPYRAFLHLLTIEDQRRALGCVREHLAEDGRLVFNVFDPSLEIIGGHFGPLGTAVKKHVEFVHPATNRRVIVWDSRQYDPVTQRIEQYFIFEELDDTGLVVSKRYNRLTLRWVYRYEMEHLLELSGFRVEALYGDFQRGPFRHGGEQIWVAQPV